MKEEGLGMRKEKCSVQMRDEEEEVRDEGGKVSD